MLNAQVAESKYVSVLFGGASINRLRRRGNRSSKPPPSKNEGGAPGVRRAGEEKSNAETQSAQRSAETIEVVGRSELLRAVEIHGEADRARGELA